MCHQQNICYPYIAICHSYWRRFVFCYSGPTFMIIWVTWLPSFLESFSIILLSMLWPYWGLPFLSCQILVATWITLEWWNQETIPEWSWLLHLYLAKWWHVPQWSTRPYHHVYFLLQSELETHFSLHLSWFVLNGIVLPLNCCCSYILFFQPHHNLRIRSYMQNLPFESTDHSISEDTLL